MPGTTLNPGDIAFLNIDSGHAAGANDAGDTQFAFVTLTALAAGTTINFTDRGWNGTAFQTGSASTNDGTVTFTATSAISAGTIMVVARDATKGGYTSLNEAGMNTPAGRQYGYAIATTGTVAVSPSDTAGNFDLGNDGQGQTPSADQVFAYQGADTNPTFIAAIATGAFTPAGTTISDTDPTQSQLPSGLTAGNTAIVLGDAKADYFNGTLSGTAAQIRAELNDPASYQEPGLAYNTADGSIVVQPGAPTITGTTGGQTTTAEAPVVPFASAVVTDPNGGGATDTLTIALQGGGGTLAGAGTVNADGTYTLTGTAAAVTSQLQAVSFTPTNTTPGATVSTTFTLTDASSAGPSASDSMTVVADTAAPAVVTPAPAAPTASVSLARAVTYQDGVFTLSGTASSTAGVRNVEISALVDGVRQDLGAATVNADGTFTFAEQVGDQQTFFVATLTDGTGRQATSVDPGFNLTGGLGPNGGIGKVENFDAVQQVSTTLYRANGSRFVSVDAPGQTVDLQPSDIVAGHHQAGTSFVYTPGAESGVVDVIGGFKLGGADHDTLVLPSSDFRNFAGVLRNTGDVGCSAFITDPKTGDAIRLAGVTTAELKAHPKDFSFA